MCVPSYSPAGAAFQVSAYQPSPSICLLLQALFSPDQSAGSLLIGVHWPSQCHAIRGTHSRVSLKAAPLLQEAGSILVAHVQSITKQTFAIATSKAARAQCSSFLTHAWQGGAFWAAQHKNCSQRQLANPIPPLERSQTLKWQHFFDSALFPTQRDSIPRRRQPAGH